MTACLTCHSKIVNGVCEGCGLIVQSQLPGPKRVGIVERIPEAQGAAPQDREYDPLIEHLESKESCGCGEGQGCNQTNCTGYPTRVEPGAQPPQDAPEFLRDCLLTAIADIDTLVEIAGDRLQPRTRELIEEAQDEAKLATSQTRSTPSPDQKGNKMPNPYDLSAARRGAPSSKLATILTGAAQILDTLKIEWKDAWSEWDQSIRDGITEQQKLIYNAAPDSPPQIVSAPDVERADDFVRRRKTASGTLPKYWSEWVLLMAEYASSSNAALQRELDEQVRADALTIAHLQKNKQAAESKLSALDEQLQDMKHVAQSEIGANQEYRVCLDKITSERDGLREALREIAKIPTVMANSYLLGIVEAALGDPK